ncbi:MAG: nucleotidyltransferase family protein [Phaeodactylibacter sp.]|nr:nucleotidyltransferase family protein [Phaeodactylibacter sp.]
MPVVDKVCVVLAAGASTRMGRPKQLLELDGQPLIARVCDQVRSAGFDAVVVVTGANRDKVEKALPPSVNKVYNKDWQSGMGSSVRTGIAFCTQKFPDLQLAGFVLTDQPFLSSSLLKALLSGIKGKKGPGIATMYGGGLGVPAIFRTILFPELLNLKGQKGAKSVLMKYQSSLLSIPFPKGEIDLDYPEDWSRFLKNRQ